jgi:hypothetical protein
MHVKIDISENVRFIEKDSILAVTTDDGCYRKNVCLYPRVKRRIKNYSGKREIVHSIMVYHLIKDELQKYTSITICKDVSKNKLQNCLAKLFKDNAVWDRIKSQVFIRPVNKCYVHKYANRVREEKEIKGDEINLELFQKYEKIFNIMRD